MKKMKMIKSMLILGIISFVLYSFTSIVQDEWNVPEKYVTMQNPISPEVDINIGKSLYSQHCKSCHGKEGYGDGTKSNDLDGNLGDFSSAEYHKQTDGTLFYKTKFGRLDMPEYKKKLTDEDMWLIVNHMRTLEQ